MKTYIVGWEVRKKARVEAESMEAAIDMVNSGEVEGEEVEIVTSPEGDEA